MDDIDTSGVTGPGASIWRIAAAVRGAATARLFAAEFGIVLDIGCGNGPLLASLDLPDACLVGVDLDPELLREARSVFLDKEVQGLHLSFAHAGALPFRDKSIDNILFLNTFLTPRRTTTPSRGWRNSLELAGWTGKSRWISGTAPIRYSFHRNGAASSRPISSS